MAKTTPAVFVTVKRASKVKDDALYFVRRNGGYFRPKAAGYTDVLADAGTFIGAEAKKYFDAEGITLHPVKPLMPILRKELSICIRRAHALSLLIDSEVSQ